MAPVRPRVDVEAVAPDTRPNHRRVDSSTQTFGRYRDDSDEDGSIDQTAPLDPNGNATIAESTSPWNDRLTRHVPPGLTRIWRTVVTWVKGPDPPRIYRINPIFPRIQHLPINAVNRVAPKTWQKFFLLLVLYAGWLATFSALLDQSAKTGEIAGYGDPARLSCAATYWSDGNACDLNGAGCRPFANSTLAFRCPASCSKTQVLNPHAVGDQEIVYRQLVVGGPAAQSVQLTSANESLVGNAVYRADSFICASAIHAGFIRDNEGGCGVLALTGEQTSFIGSLQNGIDSVAFDSYFPRSFGFLVGTRAECKDLRWIVLIPSVIFSALLSLFTTSPGVHFWSLFVLLFTHVALVSDPPANTDYYTLVSIAIGRFLPACFCAWVIYRYAVKRSLAGLTAQVEKTILWLGPAWVGSLNNYTFDKIPIQRLTPHDIQAQPGAIPALIIIIVVLIAVALNQAWSFRMEGRMPRYLAVYGIMAGTLIIFLIIPGLDLRIHHYILGLLLIPGTSFQNRVSLVCQGLLLGLFINGVARWGFAPLLETPDNILAGVAQGTLLPAISVIAASASNITFDLGALPIWDANYGTTYDGISILVNDVERFHAYADDATYWPDNASGFSSVNLLVANSTSGNFTWTWSKHTFGADNNSSADGKFRGPARPAVDGENVGVSSAANATAAFPEYFRFGYLSGSSTADYTLAGKWEADGTWRQMGEGPSKKRRRSI